MRLALVLLAGCSSTERAPVREPPLSPARGPLRIEGGVPPIDPAIRKALAPFVTSPQARVLDYNGSVLVLAHGDCVEISAEVIVDRLRGRSRPIVEAARGCIAEGSNLAIEWAGFGADHRIVYAADRSGDEQTALYALGEPAPVSPPGRVNDPIWDRKRTRVLFGLAGELWGWERGTPARRIATGGPWAPLDTSEDGRFVLVRRELATRESALYRIAIETGEAIALTEVGKAAAARAQFTADGDLIAITDGGGDRKTLERIATRYRQRLAPELPGEVTDFVIADDHVIFVTSTIDGPSTLHRLDLATGAHAPMRGAPADGVIADLRTTDAGSIAFTFSSPTVPRKLVVMLPHATESGVDAEMRWPEIPQRAPLAKPSTHHVTARDGVRSSLFAYLPAVATKAPVVIELHGGPDDRWSPRHDGFTQFLVARGHAVIQPNVRGSSGEGRAFAALDDGIRREDPLRDVAAVLDWIAAQPALDASRVVVMGTSYGGYLSLAALQAFPDRLRGGITLGAITDFVGFLEGTAAWRREHRRAEYGDERDRIARAFLAKVSPIARVAQLSRPILMAWGARDPRVPPTTSAAFARAARAAGQRVWSLEAADEGHWFTRGENRDAFEVLATQFLASL